MYIVFEGVVGTGKTTQSQRLAEWLQKLFPERPVVWTREPGGTEIAQAIRKLVQATPFEEEMDPICEAYLYAASRAQAISKIIKPCLKRGGIVVSDRSFITSLAYQGYARCAGIGNIWKINRQALSGIFPNMVIFLDLDVETALSRSFDVSGDKWEKQGVAFFRKVREGYLTISRGSMFRECWYTISALGEEDDVFDNIYCAISACI
ncbi:MAG: dTMP kinase [bacterium]